jgi:hypothetical protein
MASVKPAFEYRCWSMSTFHNLPLLEATLDRALAEAPRHNINVIEIKDYCGSWIDLPDKFEKYPKLAAADTLTIQNAALTRRQRFERAATLKRLAKKVKAAGLELQVWYHCFGHWAKEITQLYPQLADASSQELYDFLAQTVRDGLDYYDEIDGITITSLNETPSILYFSGETSLADRLERLYRVFVDVCAERKKRLIFRDFIVKKSEFDLFDQVMHRLPDWVWVETKDIVADWGGEEKPLNPLIPRYANYKKPLLVEFELSNNYAGEMEIPWCHPEYLWRRIRLMAEMGLKGGIGRLVNTDHVVDTTIFDTPNDIMVWAFSRFMVDPGRLLRRDSDEWDRSYDQFDMSLWRNWADEKFGSAAAPAVITLLRRTPMLMDLTINHCGSHLLVGRFNMPDTAENRKKFAPQLTHPYRSIPYALRAIRLAGGDLARTEKAEAMRLVLEGLAQIEQLRPSMKESGYRMLFGAYDRSKYIVGICQAMVDALVTAMEVDAGKAKPQQLEQCCARLHAAGDATAAAYGPRLLEGMPIAAHVFADYILQLPGRINEHLEIAERPFRTE